MIVRIKMLFLDAMKELEKGKTIQKGKKKETQRFKKMDNYVVCFEWENSWNTDDVVYFIADYSYDFTEDDATFEDWQVVE